MLLDPSGLLEPLLGLLERLVQLTLLDPKELLELIEAGGDI